MVNTDILSGIYVGATMIALLFPISLYIYLSTSKSYEDLEENVLFVMSLIILAITVIIIILSGYNFVFASNIINITRLVFVLFVYIITYHLYPEYEIYEVRDLGKVTFQVRYYGRVHKVYDTFEEAQDYLNELKLKKSIKENERQMKENLKKQNYERKVT